jgi:predicted permease
LQFLAAIAEPGELGNLTRVAEEARATWGWARLEQLIQDVHFALRTMRKTPGFALMAALSLAIGIGANTAIFSLVDALVLKLLPVANPQELVFLGTETPRGTDHTFYFETYQRIQRDQSLFTGLAAFSPVQLNVSADGQSEPSVEGQLVSGNYMSLMGITPAVGRPLTPDDDRLPGAHPVAMISHRYWQRRFGASREIAGRKILIDGYPFTIIGVTPSSFFGLEVGRAPDVVVPLMMQPQVMPDAENWLKRPVNTVDWLRIVGRLRPGVTLRQASSGMSILFGRIQKQLAAEIDPDWQKTWLKGWAEAKLVVEPGRTGLSELRHQFSAPLFVLFALLGVVLLIVCANVANLLLARAATRQREMAVRLAIGAGRLRLIRQLLTESVLLACFGGGFGALVAYAGSQALVHFLSVGRTSISLDLSPDIRVFVFTGLVSMLTGILFGVAPAFRSSKVDLTPALKDGSGSSGSRQRFGKSILVIEVALTLVVVIAAALFISSLCKVNGIDPGFQREHVLVVRLEPKGSDQKRPNATRLQRLYVDLQEKVRSIPGVIAAGLAGASPTTPLQARIVRTPDRRQFRISWTQVFPGYFDSLGVPVLQGRDFGRFDLARGAPYVAVINETFAKVAFPNENPIGKKIVCSGEQVCDVIGVVKDIRYSSLREQTPSVMYQPFLQAPTGRGQMVLHVRFKGNNSVLPEVRRYITGLDPNMPAFEIRTLAAEVNAALVRDRLLALLSGLFGGLAVLLAVIGLYGVISYAANRRAKEIGVRMALGASARDVRYLVLRETLALAGLGIVIGIPITLAASRLIETFLYGLTPTDPVIICASAVFLLWMALIAGYLPSRRASRLDPVVVLRNE